jgi:hypothetical protein
MRPRVFVSLAVALAVTAAAPVLAQDFESLFAGPLPEGRAPAAPEQFGGGANRTLIPIQSFVGVNTDQIYAGNIFGYYSASLQADAVLWAPLDVPVGVNVQEVCVEGFDNDDAEALAVLLIGAETGSAGNPAPGFVNLAGAATTAAGVPGFVTLCMTPVGSFTFPLAVRTSGNLNGTGTASTIQYYILVALPATRTAGSVAFGPGAITWQRVVPAGPPTATFSDVPTTHIFYRWIETLAASGITGGCLTGPPRYCPNDPITRGQMAVFVAQALGLYFPN